MTNGSSPFFMNLHPSANPDPEKHTLIMWEIDYPQKEICQINVPRCHPLLSACSLWQTQRTSFCETLCVCVWNWWKTTSDCGSLLWDEIFLLLLLFFALLLYIWSIELYSWTQSDKSNSINFSADDAAGLWLTRVWCEFSWGFKMKNGIKQMICRIFQHRV